MSIVGADGGGRDGWQDAVRGVLARLLDRLDLHNRYRSARARLIGLRDQQEKDRLAEALDRLSDRQLAVLGLDRAFLYTEIEARYEAIAGASDAPSGAAAALRRPAAHDPDADATRERDGVRLAETGAARPQAA